MPQQVFRTYWPMAQANELRGRAALKRGGRRTRDGGCRCGGGAGTIASSPNVSEPHVPRLPVAERSPRRRPHAGHAGRGRGPRGGRWVNTIAQARAQLGAAKPTLVLADLQLADGWLTSYLPELTSESRHGRPCVLAVAMSLGESQLLEALCHGADGYFLQGGSSEALVKAAHLALAGEATMAPEIARQVKAHFDALDWDPTDFVGESLNPPASDRQRTAAAAMGRGGLPAARDRAPHEDHAEGSRAARAHAVPQAAVRPARRVALAGRLIGGSRRPQPGGRVSTNDVRANSFSPSLARFG